MTDKPAIRRTLANDLRFLGHDSEMASRIGDHDWTSTPLGPPGAWPQSLKVAVRIALTTRHPVIIFWGFELLCLYNDACVALPGFHQQFLTLGAPGKVACADFWSVIGPSIAAVMDGRVSTGSENQVLPTIYDGDEQRSSWTCSFSPIDDEASPGGIGGVMVQLTETNQTWAHHHQDLADAEVKASQHLLADVRTMADDVPVMLWVTDARGRCVWLNARWLEYTGLVGDVVLPTGWLDLVHPDDRAHSTGNFIAANAAHTSYRSEYRLRGPDGNYRWVLDAASPRFGPSGEYLGFVGSVIDIDDRRVAEDRLRVSDTRFRAAVDAIQGVLWTNSADGRMIGEQPGWSALTGQAFGQYQDFGWSKAVHPDDAQGTIDAWNDAVAEKRPFVFEHRIRRADDSWGSYVIRAVPILAAGKVVEWVGVHTDITVQRAAEAELRALNATLEDRIAAELRTRAKIEAALRQSQKMEAIGQLTSGIAHDFNNMLTVVIGGLQVLSRTLDPANAKAHRYLDLSLEGAQRAAGLVERLLAFSRQQPFKLGMTDINAVLHGMTDMLRQALDGRVTLQLNLETTLPPLLTDAGLLESAILNLAVNAGHAMPNGGILQITTSLVPIEGDTAMLNSVDAGLYALIAVADSGSGMPADIVEKAFEPFFTTKEVGKGTGLGLSQVHGFARQNGGNVTILSELGRGTEVRILLPIPTE